MFQRRYRLCEVFGIPLYLDFSLLLLLVMFATGGNGLVAGLVCAAALLFSITAHELGHALTARVFGYSTRDITLSLLGGCASLIALPRRPSQEFLTAIAGPAVSFALALAGVFGIAACAVDGGVADAFLFVAGDVLSSFGLHVSFGGEFYIRRSLAPVVEAALYFSVMNAMLGLFNLLPGFPMDGGRVFRSFMRAFTSRTTATRIAMVVGRVFAVLLALSAIRRVVSGGSWGFVTLLIAWMIWREGAREYRQVLAEESWASGGWDFSARVSPPPYGGKGGESEIRRN